MLVLDNTVVRPVRVHAEYYARFQERYGQRRFSGWLAHLLTEYEAWWCNSAHGSIPEHFSFPFQEAQKVKTFRGWLPECGSKGVTRTTIRWADSFWAKVDQCLQGRFEMFVNEVLEDEMLSPARKIEKFNHWRGAGKRTKQTVVKDESKLQEELLKIKEVKKNLHDRISELKNSVNAAYEMGTALMHYIMSLPVYPSHLNVSLSFFREPRSSRDKQIDSEKPETNS